MSLSKSSFILGVIVGLLIVPCVALIVAFSGMLRFHADATPGQIETALARRSVDAYVARLPAATNPYATADDATLLEGMTIYRRNCAGCHGTFSAPSEWGTKSFYPPVPQFADHHPKRTDAQIFHIVKHGIRYSGMGGWSHLMADDRIWKVATFLSRLDSLPEPVRVEWERRH